MHLRAPPGTTSGAPLLRKCTAADAFETQDSALPFPRASVCVSHIFSVQLWVKTGKPRSEKMLTAVPPIADMKLVHVRPYLMMRSIGASAPQKLIVLPKKSTTLYQSV